MRVMTHWIGINMHHETKPEMAKKVESGSKIDATSPGDICEEVRQAYSLIPGAPQGRIVAHHRRLSLDARRWLQARSVEMYHACCEERQQMLMDTWTSKYGKSIATLLLWLWRLGLV